MIAKPTATPPPSPQPPLPPPPPLPEDDPMRPKRQKERFRMRSNSNPDTGKQFRSVKAGRDFGEAAVVTPGVYQKWYEQYTSIKPKDKKGNYVDLNQETFDRHFTRDMPYWTRTSKSKRANSTAKTPQEKAELENSAQNFYVKPELYDKDYGREGDETIDGK